ncbi:MAG: HAMP domain-containing histidine kinase [Opitutales bacterium]|nr:HAMP domain-containing histidine kinase [Opitutales bacterium]NRA25792.1 HAMP domain-containing histidine kinase [Opitutales bacterium]
MSDQLKEAYVAEASPSPPGIKLSTRELPEVTRIVTRGSKDGVEHTAEEAIRDLMEEMAVLAEKANTTEMISGIIHNLGNVLNSLNISILMLEDRLSNSKVSGLERLCLMIQEHASESKFLSEHPKGKHIPDYLDKLTQVLKEDIEKSHTEVMELQQYVSHMKELTRVQQNLAKKSNTHRSIEPVEMESVVEEAILLHQHSFNRHSIELVTHFEPGIIAETDKHKLIQVVVNFISNAKEACSRKTQPTRRVILRTWQTPDNMACIEVEDSGTGISPEQFEMLFRHGFTTKKSGHGFGLHSCRKISEELGGYIEAFSEGIGYGARFSVFIPCTPTVHTSHD